jgi:predicted ABC-class ATPase
MPTLNDLTTFLQRLEGKPYPAYKDLRGRYDFGEFTLSLDHIQGDPFASPSRLSIHIDHANSGLPADLFSNPSRRTGTETYLALAFSAACGKARDHLGSGKSGLLAIDTPGQEMLARSCVEIGEETTIVRFVAGLPANGRRILARAAITLLTELIPQVTERTLFYKNLLPDKIQSYADTSEDADALRAQLEAHKLIAFLPDGAILPRASGIDNRPLTDAVPFLSPESLRITLKTPHAGLLTGCGIPEGVTLIVGGGYHGKSTLLNALETGIYNHRPGDGRHQVVTRNNAVKVRAEDGRAVTSVNLTPFINNLPGGKSTESFTTENASGSTSQAANIMEALEIGSKCLLLDEDISATNFLIRDTRMAQLIADDKEPITPFVQRVRPLFEQHGISTVLVLGGSGDYFAPANTVIAMDEFLPHEVTAKAKEIVSSEAPTTSEFRLPSVDRTPDPESINPYRAAKPSRGRGGSNRPPRPRIKAHDTRALSFGEEEIDLSLVPQLLDPSQTRTIGALLAHAKESGLLDGHRSLASLCHALVEDVEKKRLSHFPGHDLAAIRPFELAAAINRLRGLRIRPH